MSGVAFSRRIRFQDDGVDLPFRYHVSGEPAGTVIDNPLLFRTEINGGAGSGLVPSGVVPGTYGDTTHVGQFTVDINGIITFAQDVPIVAGGGGTGAPLYETFGGPAASVTLAIVPIAAVIFKNGVEQHSDGVGVAEGFYALAGNTLTVALAAGDVLDVYEWPAGGGPAYESFIGPAASVNLAMVPTIVLVEKNGVQQHDDGFGATEGTFALAGNVLTIQLAAGDILDVYEWA